MTHISRPFQIALAALVLFLAVWFVALRGHSSGGESSSSSAAAAPTTAAPSSSSRPSAPSSSGGGTPASQGGVYHGSAPGVEGLSRAIQRARGAVAQSQQNAKRQEAGQSSGGAQGQNAQTQSSHSQGQAQTSPSQSSHQSASGQKQSRQAQHAQQTKSVSGAPAMQAVVEGELKRGKVVAVLFWNPSGTVDATVRRELRAAARAQHGKLAVHVARSAAVGSFGSFTHAVQVYSTPTILLINVKGKTSSVTGLTDAFSIGQAIKEVKRTK
jgi:hypothetical protein